MKSIAFAAAVALMSIPATAMAQSAAPAAQSSEAPGKVVRSACFADVQKFCANVERGKGQMRGCLESHKNELSDVCKNAMAERAARREKS